MSETKSLTLAQQIERPEIVARFTKTLGNNQNKAQAFLRSVVIATQSNPLLKNADPMTVLASAMVAASLDLEINQNLGYAALVPYKDKCQFQLMTNGYVQLFFRSGLAKKLNTFIVYEDEYNGFDKITGELKPLKDHDENCTKVAGYGVFMELTNGFSKTEYWSKAKVQAHAMKYSQAYKKGLECPWKSAFDQMAIKTVLKYVLNHYAPKTTEAMAMALSADQSVVSFGDDDSLSFNYIDNPSKIIPEYTDEEMTIRNDYISILNGKNITIEDIYQYYKADSIEFVTTDQLKERVEAVTGLNS